MKEFFIEFLRFLRTKVFIKNFVFAISGAFLLIVVCMFILDIYTHHGEANSLPNFRGLTLDEAQRLADDKDLKLEIIDSVYNAPGRKGSVVEQTPPPDFKVKENRTIFITIKTFSAEKVPMPNFMGVSIIQAKAEIEINGFKLGKLAYRADIGTNVVLDQRFEGKSIPAGTMIEKGSKIDFVLGKSADGDVTSTVPDLIDQNRQEAELTLLDKFLTVGACIYDATVKTEQDSLKAKIWKHSPVEGITVMMGGSIDLWLTLDKKKIKEDDN